MLRGLAFQLRRHGFEDRLVGRSHECDFPPSVRALPALTQPKIDACRPSSEKPASRIVPAESSGAPLFCPLATSNTCVPRKVDERWLMPAGKAQRPSGLTRTNDWTPTS